MTSFMPDLSLSIRPIGSLDNHFEIELEAPGVTGDEVPEEEWPEVSAAYVAARYHMAGILSRTALMIAPAISYAALHHRCRPAVVAGSRVVDDFKEVDDELRAVHPGIAWAASNADAVIYDKKVCGVTALNVGASSVGEPMLLTIIVPTGLPGPEWWAGQIRRLIDRVTAES
ncbi:hypothetical protein [Jiangella muralis]|uniref:hypothetical protein n=1 Tax=Jiangella muralis TaxID=702383 RepID=UPI00069E57B6|nr:hypothetical protein [Jiangella muralis]